MTHIIKKEIIKKDMKELKEIFYKREGMKALLTGVTPTDSQLLKIGELQNDYETVGLRIAQTVAGEAIAEGSIKGTETITSWSCNFDECSMEITLG